MNEIDALIAGRHHDPHQVLGIHTDRGRLVARALRPGATRVVLRFREEEHVLTRRRGDLFEVVFDHAQVPSNYVFETTYRDGTVVTERDPYGFLPTLGEVDLYLHGEGHHGHLTNVLGARPHESDGAVGTAFSVWAPSAHAVSLVGDFNAWNPISHPMRALGSSGVWDLFVPGLTSGTVYKFAVLGRDGMRRHKADPLARANEVPPRTASIVFDSKYEWKDTEWARRRASKEPWREPISIYEVHLGSWKPGLSYRELAEQLGDYVCDLGFTHLELMPIMEHPFSGSWGYQVTGFYAPTSRFGTPDEYKEFVDILHRRGIGVILDWVPAHFPKDEWSLAKFDGSALYEHEDVRRGEHPDWGTLIFNHGRNEVRNFLVSSARTWLDEFHSDGLRVDAVASMLYLDYSRVEGGWVPNQFGGREDLEALAFLRELNSVAYHDHPSTMMIAEESTAWPGVSRPVSVGGLGFGFKWNMGWMHDTLKYFALEPIHRRFHHNELTFSLLYAFTENFVLPLSHDEVVHGKGSLFNKMPGDRWQKFANLRALYGYMWAHPGKKLLFMGGEFAQIREWNHERALDWELLEDEHHSGITTLMRDLNRVYRSERALWELDFESGGFQWISANDADNNVIAFARSGNDPQNRLVCICNLSPNPREHYRIGVPLGGRWREILNTDSTYYGGSNVGNGAFVESDPQPSHGQPSSIELRLPPLATIWLVPEASSESGR